MKLIFTTLVILCAVMAVNGQGVNPNYDSTLAKSLGADENGMKMYILVILKTGSNDMAESKTKKDSLFKGHMENIFRLVEQKKLIVSGPFGKNDGDFRGLFILNVATREEAMKLLESDPAIQANLLKPELYKWYGSAALPEYLKSVDKVIKKK